MPGLIIIKAATHAESCDTLQKSCRIYEAGNPEMAIPSPFWLSLILIILRNMPTSQ